MTETFLVVGSLNRHTPYFESASGVGLSVFAFDADAATTLMCEERSVDNPTFLAVEPETACIYAVSEVFGWHEGTASAYRYDRGARRLRYINKQPCLGSTSTHCSLDGKAQRLLVANYGFGPAEEGPDRAFAVFPIREDRGLSPAVGSALHKGRGPRDDRQERPHPHCALASPDGRFVIVADLGLDALFTYGFDALGGILSAPVAVCAFPAGSGPRHVAFHPNGCLAVAIRELDSTLTTLRYDAPSGRLSPLYSVSALPDGYLDVSHSSDIQIGCDGRVVYVANRGHDSVAAFALDAESGALTLLGHEPCGGRTPRAMAIDPSGRYLAVANQNSDVVTIFELDPTTGRLVGCVSEIRIGSPMCVRFLALS